MRRARKLTTCALVALLAGCTGPSPTERASSGLAERIVMGVASSADQDGIVLLRALLDDESELVCTATLVGPNLILTAQHCVSYLNEGQFACSVRGEPTDNPEGGGRLGLHLPAERLEIYGGKAPRKTALAHGLQVISTQSATICKNDIAFVVLDTSLDLPIMPMRLDRPAEPHEATVLVGYGLDESQEGIDYRTQPRRQKRDLEISAIGPDSIADGVSTVPPRALILRGPSGCIGDSGGPLLAQSSGAVLGVYSLQDGVSCSDPRVRHQMVHVPPFSTLIDEAFSAAGCLPTPEPEAETGSEAGAGAGTGGQAELETDSETQAGGSGGRDDGGNGNVAGVPSEHESESETAHSASCSFAAPRGSLGWSISALAALLGVVRRRVRRRGR